MRGGRQRRQREERQAEGASSSSSSVGGGGEEEEEGGEGGVTQGVRLMSRHLLTTAAGKEAADELKPAGLAKPKLSTCQVSRWKVRMC